MSFRTANYDYQGPFSLAEISAVCGAKLIENAVAPSVKIVDLAPLHSAKAGELSFFDNPKYLAQFQLCKASACIVGEKYVAKAPAGIALLVAAEPYLAYAKIAQKFYTLKAPEIKIAASAKVANTAQIGENVSIGENSIIGDGVKIGDDSIIGNNVSIRAAQIGKNCVVHDGARIGQEGFGFAMTAQGHVKVPQLGGVEIGDEVEIGANTCIDRGSGPNTKIGSGTKIDNLVQIGHNVEIGRNCIIVSQVGIAGSTKIDDFVIIGGQAGLAGHLQIGAGVRISASSGVMRDIPAKTTVGGFPAINIRDWHKTTLMLEKLTKTKNSGGENV